MGSCWNRLWAGIAIATAPAVAAGAPARVTALNVSSCPGEPGCSRLDIRLSRPVAARLLALEAAGTAAARLVVDLPGSRLAAGVDRRRPLDDPRLAGLRTAVHADGRLRLVVDLARAATGTLADLDAAGGLRLEVRDTPSPPPPAVGSPAPPSRAPAAVPPSAAPPPAPSPPSALGGGRRRCVVLDPGHGGQDPGALGAGGLEEKTVVLAVARQARALLEARGVAVALTRDDDSTLSLDARTQLANRLGADAFVSIHANADARRHASGIETYFLNVTDNRYSIRLAARENRTTERQVDDLQLILADLSTKFHSRASSQLAREVQGSLVRQVGPLHPKVRDLGVKQALFYVLLGARMPSILVETSFLTHPVEARLLAQPAYQRRLARGIAEAVAAHLRQPFLEADAGGDGRL